MTPTECLEACMELSDKHSFIITEQAQLCRHKDGHLGRYQTFRITVFAEHGTREDNIVFNTRDLLSFDAALDQVRDYFATLQTEQP